ncbi:MAG TPA: hypothetical protein VG433_12915 [Pirellulales bacterium]|nr:hypothetical protein [Pirellulales bacterium]
MPANQKPLYFLAAALCVGFLLLELAGGDETDYVTRNKAAAAAGTTAIRTVGTLPAPKRTTRGELGQASPGQDCPAGQWVNKCNGQSCSRQFEARLEAGQSQAGFTGPGWLVYTPGSGTWWFYTDDQCRSALPSAGPGCTSCGSGARRRGRR